MMGYDGWVISKASQSEAVDRINLPFFYTLGTALHPLCELKVDQANTYEVFTIMLNARTITAKLLDDFPDLTVCRAVGQELRRSIEDAFMRRIFRAVPGQSVLLEDLSTSERDIVNRIINTGKRFETVLAEELSTLSGYLVTQKGIYSTPDLIDHTENVFPPLIRAKLPQGVIDDIRQSGRCLAFDCPTASGFHILRAAEVVLHSYYIAVCSPPNPKTLDNWGAYIAALRSSSKDLDVMMVEALLQQIKDQHRNYIMHPELILSPDEAFRLFDVAKTVIMAMVDRL